MAKRIFSTPSGDEFFVHPSFNSIQKVWFTWPQRTDNWRMGAKPIQKLIVEIINKLINYQDVNILVNKEQFQNVRKQLNEKVRVIEMSTNDCFIRDYGPLFLVNKETNSIRGLKSSFNAWGGSTYGVYYPWDNDDMVPYKIFEIENIDYYEIPIVLDWGMILLDGNSTCFASEQGILSSFNNPNLTKDQAEYYLKEYLNVANVIWLPFGLMHDQTKGRIDNIISIVNPNIILLSWTDNPHNDNYDMLVNTLEILKKSKNIEDQPYKIIKIPLPELKNRTNEEIEMIDFNFNHNSIIFNQPIIGSYTSLYITDKVVVVPLFDCENTEEEAKKIIEKVFADKKIIYINSRELVIGKSGLHSIICQQIVI